MPEQQKRFKARLNCLACDGELTWAQVIDRMGVCPLCGAVTNGPVVAHRKAAMLKVEGGWRQVGRVVTCEHTEAHNRTVWDRLLGRHV